MITTGKKNKKQNTYQYQSILQLQNKKINDRHRRWKGVTTVGTTVGPWGLSSNSVNQNLGCMAVTSPICLKVGKEGHKMY